MRRSLWMALLALAAWAPAGLAQEADPGGRARRLTGVAGEAGVTAEPAVLSGGNVPLARGAGTLSGTYRLGTVSTTEGSLVLTGTFQGGRLTSVAAARGRERVRPTPSAAPLARGLDDWRFAPPPALASAGPARECGVETTLVRSPGTGGESGLAAGAYVGVSWVCGMRTRERWLFRVPPRVAAAGEVPGAGPASNSRGRPGTSYSDREDTPASPGFSG
ncbi:MAG: hypothetical protein ABR599_06990 [Gemmatimonadota bacterium]